MGKVRGEVDGALLGLDGDVTGTEGGGGSAGVRAGRFVLLHIGFEEGMAEPELGYVTSWDTWEEAQVVFENGRMPVGFRLIDDATGRTWHPGATYDWESAQT